MSVEIVGSGPRHRAGARLGAGPEPRQGGAIAGDGGRRDPRRERRRDARGLDHVALQALVDHRPGLADQTGIGERAGEFHIVALAGEDAGRAHQPPDVQIERRVAGQVAIGAERLAPVGRGRVSGDETARERQRGRCEARIAGRRPGAVIGDGEPAQVPALGRHPACRAIGGERALEQADRVGADGDRGRAPRAGQLAGGKLAIVGLRGAVVRLQFGQAGNQPVGPARVTAGKRAAGEPGDQVARLLRRREAAFEHRLGALGLQRIIVALAADLELEMGDGIAGRGGLGARAGGGQSSVLRRPVGAGGGGLQGGDRLPFLTAEIERAGRLRVGRGERKPTRRQQGGCQGRQSFHRGGLLSQMPMLANPACPGNRAGLLTVMAIAC